MFGHGSEWSSADEHIKNQILPEVSLQPTMDSSVDFTKTDGSCMVSCQGFAVVKSPWELLSAGLGLPCVVPWQVAGVRIWNSQGAGRQGKNFWSL